MVPGHDGRTTRRFTITLTDDDARRLSDLARVQRRDPRAQASLLLERALRRRSRPDGGRDLPEAAS